MNDKLLAVTFLSFIFLVGCTDDKKDADRIIELINISEAHISNMKIFSDCKVSLDNTMFKLTSKEITESVLLLQRTRTNKNICDAYYDLSDLIFTHANFNLVNLIPRISQDGFPKIPEQNTDIQHYTEAGYKILGRRYLSAHTTNSLPKITISIPEININGQICPKKILTSSSILLFPISVSNFSSRNIKANVLEKLILACGGKIGEFDDSSQVTQA